MGMGSNYIIDELCIVISVPNSLKSTKGNNFMSKEIILVNDESRSKPHLSLNKCRSSHVQSALPHSLMTFAFAVAFHE